MLLDDLEDEIKTPERMPLTSKSLIDVDYFLERSWIASRRSAAGRDKNRDKDNR